MSVCSDRHRVEGQPLVLLHLARSLFRALVHCSQRAGNEPGTLPEHEDVNAYITEEGLSCRRSKRAHPSSGRNVSVRNR